MLVGPGTRADIVGALGATSVPNKSEGYALVVTGNKIAIGGSDADGQFYGVQTLRQLLAGSGATAAVANVSITDWPLIGVRGTIEGFYGMPW